MGHSAEVFGPPSQAGQSAQSTLAGAHVARAGLAGGEATQKLPSDGIRAWVEGGGGWEGRGGEELDAFDDSLEAMEVVKRRVPMQLASQSG